ncbi:C-type mannose receptor 2 isoform X1 [Salmo salar]|uniref:C-type mannose receptor 2 isoform X1 n=1 Tax=Salmo salar TaxID=8030 RepID=A0ABM3DF71_SALSA|nr:C-type mannose receptor 2-like isoform X1 [Salmo salar]
MSEKQPHCKERVKGKERRRERRTTQHSLGQKLLTTDMEGRALILVLSGLCTLSSCLTREYHYVSSPKTWTEAQRYCREKYTDLATIENMEDMKRLINTVDIGYNGSVWIGLEKGDIMVWQWSLANRDYYGEEGTGFRKWSEGEPDNGMGRVEEECAVMNENGQWHDMPFNFKLSVYCYDDKNNIKVNNNELMTWREAQLYCRKHHTDLPSVKNQRENNVLQNLVLGSGLMWIGLFRDSWKWSDQSDSSFRYWGPNQPINRLGNQNCTAVWEGVWTEHPCMYRIPFVCYGVKKTQQMVRVRLTTKEQNMDLTDPDMHEAILQQIKKDLRENGMSDDVKLRWKEQPDGNIFRKEKKMDLQKKKMKERIPVMTKREL